MEALEGIDWSEAWVERSKKRREPDNQDYWDSRSVQFKEHSGISAYTDIFLDYLDIAPDWSVLDMGSGPGTLAIPLAKAGHQVIAADFSSGMRQACEERVAQFGLQNVEVKALDWNEDWLAAGVEPKSVDAAIASRSTIVDDLGEALLKLDNTARHKAAITMVTEYSPRGHKAMGSNQEGVANYIPDFIYGVNILLQMGAYPELRYIDTTHGNGGDMEKKLVRWAFISWQPIS